MHSPTGATEASQDLDREALKLSIQSLQRIYTFIMALAIAVALGNLVLSPETNVPDLQRLISDVSPVFVAFFITVVPFFHGMNRHLDDYYALGRMPKSPRGPVSPPRPGAVMIDLSAFVFEAGLLYLLALTLLEYRIFFTLLGVLFVVDLVWAFITWCMSSSPAIKWAVINLGAAPAIFVSLWLDLPTNALLTLLTTIAVLRTIIDYSVNWDFYFPQGK